MSNPDDLKRKKIVFEGYEKQYADMRIRLTYDGLTQGQFFRGIMLGYTSADPDIVSFVEELKEKIKNQGLKKRNASKKFTSRQRECNKQFALSEKEKEDIFDLISEEIGEL